MNPMTQPNVKKIKGKSVKAVQSITLLTFPGILRSFMIAIGIRRVASAVKPSILTLHGKPT
jgi:hypothetical protein